MTFISKKIIKGKTHYYLERSVRLPTGKVKKYSLYLGRNRPNKESDLGEVEKRLIQKMQKDLIAGAISMYKKNAIFNEATLRSLEEIRIAYKSMRQKLTKKQLQDIIDRFAANFAYESNAIEGNSLTLKDVRLLFYEKVVTREGNLREIYEALNTGKALQLVFQNRLHIREKDIMHLHSLLVHNTGTTLGYKKLPNFILGKNLQTTPPERVSQEMKTLFAKYEKDASIHPLQRAADFHGRFERIHPFEDGNGRVGRLVVNIILLRSDYPPIIIRKTQRVAYFAALSAFDHGHPDKLYRFFLEKYKQTHKQFFQVYLKYLK